ECFRTENNQSYSVRRKALSQVFQFKLNTLQSAGAYVSGIHGLGQIHGNKDVFAFFLDFFQGCPDGRTRKRNKKKYEIDCSDDYFGEQSTLLHFKLTVDLPIAE